MVLSRPLMGKGLSCGLVQASDGEGFAGPTLARDLPDWQQSQSLYLHLSASSGTSQHSTQHQVSPALVTR